MKKVNLIIILISCILLSCTKENADESYYLRCATVFTQPSWAKNFNADSLIGIREVNNVIFSRKIPGPVLWDTSYTTAIPMRFLANGFGSINGNTSFQYRVTLTETYPQVLLFNINSNSLSPVFPFSNSFPNKTSITMRVEDYMKTGCRLIFDNGVEYYSAAEVYENAYLTMNRN